MKKRSFFAYLSAVVAALGVILTSCNSDESLSSQDSKKIAFVTSDGENSSWDVSTRAATVSSSDFNSKVSSFRVWGYFDSSAAAEGATPGGLFVGESASAGAVINGNGSGTCARGLRIAFRSTVDSRKHRSGTALGDRTVFRVGRDYWIYGSSGDCG